MSFTPFFLTSNLTNIRAKQCGYHSVWDEPTQEIPSGPGRLTKILGDVDDADDALKRAREEIPEGDPEGMRRVDAARRGVDDARRYFKQLGERP